MADLIIHNAKVLTQDPLRPRAQAMAILGKQIIAVGEDAEILALRQRHTRVISAGGRSVLPGLIDSHVHLFQGAAELDFLPVGHITDLQTLRDAVLDYAAARPDEPLVLGTGALYDLMQGQDRPRLALDAILADRPFALLAADLHTVWANTETLRRADLLHGATMPEGSRVVMGDDGVASGTLLETGAFGPALALSRTGGRDMLGYVTGADPVPPATQDQRAADMALLRRGLAKAAEYGITTLHNMDGNFYQLELLQAIDTQGQLTARVQIPFHLKNTDPLDRLAEAQEMHVQYQGDKLWSGRVKMFMDGVLESQTALKTLGYPGDPTHQGEAVFDPGHFNAACVRADAAGLQISVHAVGDLAVERVLDGYGAALAANGPRDARHRVEHIELITEADIARMNQLGAVASVQPRHAAFAGFFDAETASAEIFASERPRAYAWRRLREAGISLGFSTDWPVVPLNPFATMGCAVAPMNLGPGWPDQAQTRAETLHSYTAMNAWIGFREGRQGQLRPGLSADLVVLRGDVETAPDLAAMTVAMTICDGDIVFDRGEI